MAVIPEDRLSQIEFAEAHLPVWVTTPAAVGLTAGQVSLLGSLTDDARKDYDNALAARQASKAATTTMNDSVRVMRNQLADMVRSIKTFAEASANPNAIYGLAQIPPPAAPQPATAPGTPTNFQVTLQPTGAVTLSWDAENAAASSGAVFVISRKLPTQAAFTTLGFSPGSTTESRRMSFTDSTIPATAASAGAQYIVVGQRGNLVGTPSEAITVQFGVDGISATIVSGGAPLSMAA